MVTSHIGGISRVLPLKEKDEKKHALEKFSLDLSLLVCCLLK